MIAKYGGHVQQTSADVRQRGKTLPDKMSDKGNKNCYGYLPVSNWGKCLTGAQNVPQGTKGLLDILSGMPEIIFAITAVMFYLIFT